MPKFKAQLTEFIESLHAILISEYQEDENFPIFFANVFVYAYAVADSKTKMDVAQAKMDKKAESRYAALLQKNTAGLDKSIKNILEREHVFDGRAWYESEAKNSLRNMISLVDELKVGIPHKADSDAADPEVEQTKLDPQKRPRMTPPF